jgi:MFS family permease
MNIAFYGWRVLLSAFLLLTVVTMGINALPLLNAKLKEVYGWRHTEVTAGPSLLYLIVAVVSPLAGWLVDRFGPRRLMLAGAGLTVVAMLAYTQVRTPLHLQLVYGLCALSVTSGGVIAGATLLSRWFVRYRGVAVGIYLVGSSMGGIFLPQLVSRLMHAYGWQAAAVGLAVCAVALAVLPLLAIRNRPQALGLLPDGEAAPTSEADPAPVATPTGPTLAEALAQPNFYLVLFVTAAVFFGITGVVQNFALFMADLRLDSQASANVFSAFFFFSIGGKVAFGYLSDRFSKRDILLAACANMALGAYLMRLIGPGDMAMLYAFAVVYGLGYSGAFTMVQLIVAEHYSGRSFGKIIGLVTTLDTLAGSYGISQLAALREQQGSYAGGLDLLLAISLAAVGCTLLIRRHR